MNSPQEIAVAAIEREIGTVKVSPWALSLLIVPPLLIGFIARRSDFTSTESFMYVGLAILVIVIPLAFFATQKIDLTGDGIRISGPLRRTTDISWDAISHINYSAWLRWVSIRRDGRLVYFNSTDALISIFDLIIVTAYRTGYRCPKRVRDEVVGILESIAVDSAPTTES